MSSIDTSHTLGQARHTIHHARLEYDSQCSSTVRNGTGHRRYRLFHYYANTMRSAQKSARCSHGRRPGHQESAQSSVCSHGPSPGDRLPQAAKAERRRLDGKSSRAQHELMLDRLWSQGSNHASEYHVHVNIPDDSRVQKRLHRRPKKLQDPDLRIVSSPVCKRRAAAGHVGSEL